MPVSSLARSAALADPKDRGAPSGNHATHEPSPEGLGPAGECQAQKRCLGGVDALFADCCYGTNWQHGTVQNCPLELHFDQWTGQYVGDYNDVWVRQPRGLKSWEVATRERGNTTLAHGRHRSLEKAIAAAKDIIRQRLSDRVQS